MGSPGTGMCGVAGALVSRGTGKGAWVTEHGHWGRKTGGAHRFQSRGWVGYHVLLWAEALVKKCTGEQTRTQGKEEGRCPLPPSGRSERSRQGCRCYDGKRHLSPTLLPPTFFFDSLTLKIGPISSSETLGLSQPMMHNIPDDRRIQVNCSKSLWSPNKMPILLLLPSSR
jgi:hypothetical protein